jgi:hypothetical protein
VFTDWLYSLDRIAKEITAIEVLRILCLYNDRIDLANVVGCSLHRSPLRCWFKPEQRPNPHRHAVNSRLHARIQISESICLLAERQKLDGCRLCNEVLM